MSKDLEALLQRALLALDFWLPKIPDDGPEEIADRIAADAELLVHRTGAMIDDAETLGWIQLQQSGAAAAREAHNLEVGGSNPPSAIQPGADRAN